LVVPPPPQLSGAVQVPHELTVRDAPQLSVPLTLPQFFPRRAQNAPSVSAVQAPQTLAVPPPPQLSGAVQVPHELTVRDAPQLSVPLTLPQFFPRRAQNALSVSGVHVPPQAPSSLHTTPQGQPVSPGSQAANEVHILQLVLAQV
jgi:hypothetical protein